MFPGTTTRVRARSKLRSHQLRSHASQVDRRLKDTPLHNDARPNVCVSESSVLAALEALNPKLANEVDAPLYALSRRHLKVDAHSNVCCEYWSKLKPEPLGYMARANFEIRNMRNPTPWCKSFNW